MSGPKIPIEVDTSGIDRAMDHVEQRAKRSSRTLNEAMAAGWAPTGGAKSSGKTYSQHTAQQSQYSYRPQTSKAREDAERKLSGVINELAKIYGVSVAQAKKLNNNFAQLARSGVVGSSALGKHRNLLEFANSHNAGLGNPYSKKQYKWVHEAIGAPTVAGGDGNAKSPGSPFVYRAIQRIAPMAGGAGGAIGNAAGQAASGGGSALGMAGRFLGGAGIGAAMYAGYKVMQGVGDAGNEMTGYSDLRAKLGPLTTDFDHLRESVRYATKGLGLTYEEAQKMAAGFAHTANLQSDTGLGDEVKNAGGFARGFGMDPSQASDFFAQMRHFGVTQNSDDSRRMAVMIGDSVAKGGNTAKADEVLAAVSNFTSIAARQSLSAPNVEGFASMLASMTGLHLPGMDPSGAASTIGKLNAALSGGGAAGEASQNFSLGLYQRAMPGFDALDLGVMGSVGAFGTVGDAFGKDSAAYKAASEEDRKRYDGYTDAGGDRRIIDMQMEGLRNQYGGDSRMYREAGARHLGLSSVEFAAFDTASKQDGGIGGLIEKMEGLNVPAENLNTKTIAALAQLQNGGSDMLASQAKRLRGLKGSDALSKDEVAELEGAEEKGGDAFRDAVMKMTGKHDSVKDEGTRTRDTITDVKNAVNDFASKLVPLMNTVKEAMTSLVRKLAPDSEFSKKMDAKEKGEKEAKRLIDIRNKMASGDNVSRQIAERQANYIINGDDETKSVTTDDVDKRLDSIHKRIEAGEVFGDNDLNDYAAKYRKDQAEKVIANNPAPSPKTRSDRDYRKTREGVMAKIRAEAERQGVPADVALKLAQKESGFNPTAEGPEISSGTHKGDRAYGVYQYMAKSSEGWNRKDVDQNIAHGIADLKRRKEKYGTWGAAYEGHLGGDGAIGKAARSDGNATTFDYRKLGNTFESGPIPGAGKPALAGASEGRESTVKSVVILQDQKGNQLYDPIIQTHFGAPIPAGS